MLIPEEQKFQPLPLIKDEVPGMEIKVLPYFFHFRLIAKLKGIICLVDYLINTYLCTKGAEVITTYS